MSAPSPLSCQQLTVMLDQLESIPTKSESDVAETKVPSPLSCPQLTAMLDKLASIPTFSLEDDARGLAVPPLLRRASPRYMYEGVSQCVVVDIRWSSALWESPAVGHVNKLLATLDKSGAYTPVSTPNSSSNMYVECLVDVQPITA